MRRKASRLLLAACLVLLGACRAPSDERDRTVWLVHATDPHLFYGDSTTSVETRRHQERLNREGFETFLRGLAGLPDIDAENSYLVITGDFGIDAGALTAAAPGTPATSAATPPVPASSPAATAATEATPTTATTPGATPAATPTPSPATTTPSSADGPSANRAAAVAYLAEQLAASPIKTIYFVPGNNDVVGEVASGSGVDDAAAFFAEVQRGIDAKGTGVVLHDLTACYRGGAASSAGCFADVADTPFRLVGLPSYSFKNGREDEPDVRAANLRDQAAQLTQLEAMVTQAAAARKTVIVATHIPELDDPFSLAAKRYKEEAPSGRVANQPPWADTTAWNLDAEMLARWRRIVDSPTVAGVLAGHFHDSHREIYQPPYAWAPAAAERADLRKLFVAPPLAMRFQDASPIQARGFALFALRDGELKRRLVWWEPGSGAFELERAAEERRPPRRRTTFGEATTWLWRLPLNKTDLARAAVIAIALLSAFLTVVAVWQIPPPTTVPTRAVSGDGGGNASGNVSGSSPAAPTAAELGQLLFTGNFARTVLTGLGGLALVSTFDALWTGGNIDEKPYYLVLFVVFFIVGLLLSGGLRGVTEALRSRVSIARRPVLPRSRDRRERVLLPLRRFWAWVSSWRSTGLVFFDTFFNVVQGRNVLRTAVFEQEIADLHESLVRSVDVIRDELDRAFEKATGHEVRTAVALLSPDENTLFYVSRERGSLPRPFGRRSMATFCATTGLPRWWRKNFVDEKIEVDLLSEADGKFAVFPERTLRLEDYFQYREPADYQAFVILPFPWAQRGADGDARRGVILVSFAEEADLDRLWTELNLKEVEGNARKSYPTDWAQMLTTGPGLRLKPEHEELSRALLRATRLLAELLRKFNDTLFDDFVRPRHQP